MLHLISFGDKKYEKSKIRLMKEVKDKKCFKSVRIYDHIWWSNYINKTPALKSKLHIATNSRGHGFWIWKSHIILDTLLRDDINFGDVILYIDVAKGLIDSPEFIQKVANNTNDINFCMGGHKEIVYTPRKIWDYFKVKPNIDLVQCSAHCILIRKTQRSIALIRTWAYIDPLLYSDFIIDKKFESKLFKDHRHDQTIFSHLMRKNNIKGVPLTDFLTFYRNDAEVPGNKWAVPNEKNRPKPK